MCKPNVDILRMKLNFAHYLIVSRIGLGGGLLLFWKKNMDVSILSFSTGHIDYCIRDVGGDCFLQVSMEIQKQS